MNQRKTDFTYIAANTARRSFIWGWLAGVLLSGIVAVLAWGVLLVDESEMLWR
jgi:hypothetical protein